MRHRSKQNEAGDPVRVGERERGRNGAAERMAEQHKTLDANALEGLRDQRRLTRRRSIGGAARAIAPAVPRAIHQDDAAVHRKPVAEGKAHVFEIAARAMHQDDGKLGSSLRGDGATRGPSSSTCSRPPATSTSRPAAGWAASIRAVPTMVITAPAPIADRNHEETRG